MLLTLLTFIIILGVLVLVHEFGHFIVAKKSGMKVEEFGFGFPPRALGLQKSGGKLRWIFGRGTDVDPEATIYSINWIPFGGFVRIMGENNDEAADPRSFTSKGFWARFLSLAAGVTMNWLLAVVLFSVVFMIGMDTELTPGDPLVQKGQVSQRRVVIADIEVGGPAAQAGLMPQDIIVSIDGKKFEDFDSLKQYIDSRRGNEMEFEAARLAEIKKFKVASRQNPGPDQGVTGISLANIGKLKLPFFSALAAGLSRTFQVTWLMLQSLWQMVSGHVSIHNVGGPVKIAQLTGQVARLGLGALLNFAAFLSLNLAILNILPIPALDGGRILFLVVEKFRGRKNNQRVEQLANTIGFAFLILLMLAVTIKDIILK